MEKFEGGNRDTEDTSNSRPIKIPRQDVLTEIQGKQHLRNLQVKDMQHALQDPVPFTNLLSLSLLWESSLQVMTKQRKIQTPHI